MKRKQQEQDIKEEKWKPLSRQSCLNIIVYNLSRHRFGCWTVVFIGAFLVFFHAFFTVEFITQYLAVFLYLV